MITLVAEFADAAALTGALRALRDRAGVDGYAPHPLRGAEAELARRRSRLPWFCLAAGLAGAGAGYLVQWWCLAVDYPVDVGGFEPHTAVAFVPIAFESGILAAAFAAFIGVLLGNRLPRLWHPAFTVDGFARATRDRFFVSVPATPDEVAALRARLSALSALSIGEATA